MSDELASEAGVWEPVLYERLRRLAGTLMGAERDDHTLERTALVHETWLRLQQSRNAAALDESAFVGLAAQAMRRILTDHARRRAAAVRGGDARRTTLAGKELARDEPAFAVELDAALEQLARLDPELARLVELRFYAGLSVADVASALDLAPRTVKRRWRFARAWLRERVQERGA